MVDRFVLLRFDRVEATKFLLTLTSVSIWITTHVAMITQAYTAVEGDLELFLLDFSDTCGSVLR